MIALFAVLLMIPAGTLLALGYTGIGLVLFLAPAAAIVWALVELRRQER